MNLLIGCFLKDLLDCTFLKKYFSVLFEFVTDDEKNWGLSYLKELYSTKKSIVTHVSKPGSGTGKFFEKTKFYSSLINEIISDTDYENLKRFYKLMHMKNLSDLKDIYNMQDTILLCKIFKNCSSEIMKKCPCNSRECTSASSLRKCFHTFLSKAMISLPTGPYMLSFLRKTLSHAVSHA